MTFVLAASVAPYCSNLELVSPNVSLVVGLSISAGAIPVVECGVVLYCERKRDTRVSIVPLVSFFMKALNVWTALSAKPLEAGWYGADLTWRITFCFVKSSNSELVNTDPLSDTNISGNPCVAKMECKCLMVEADVGFVTDLISIHFEWASTNIRNCRPNKGPA